MHGVLECQVFLLKNLTCKRSAWLLPEFFQEPIQHASEGCGCWLPSPAHRSRPCCFVPIIRSRAQSDERGETISHGQKVGPKASRAPVAVCERMNPDPLRVCPRAQINHRVNFISAQVFPGGQGFIESGDGHLKPLFKLTQFLGNVARMRSPEPTDFHACSFEPGLSAKHTHIPPINLQTLQEGALPVSCEFEFRRFAVGGILGHLFEYSG